MKQTVNVESRIPVIYLDQSDMLDHIKDELTSEIGKKLISNLKDGVDYKIKTNSYYFNDVVGDTRVYRKKIEYEEIEEDEGEEDKTLLINPIEIILKTSVVTVLTKMLNDIEVSLSNKDISDKLKEDLTFYKNTLDMAIVLLIGDEK